MKFERRAQHPEMEERLHGKYKDLRKKGLKVKGWWFHLHARQILGELQPEANFCYSDAWFSGFKRYCLSVRHATNTCQKEPVDKHSSIQHFHCSIQRTAQEGDQVGPLGQRTQRTIANMDQTPLPFTFSDGPMYADTGERSVWVHGGASGLEKRQCTAQVTIFADGEPRVKPLLIFRETGKRITLAEKVRYDRRVSVIFQPKAWCDEGVMHHWV